MHVSGSSSTHALHNGADNRCGFGSGRKGISAVIVDLGGARRRIACERHLHDDNTPAGLPFPGKHRLFRGWSIGPGGRKGRGLIRGIDGGNIRAARPGIK